LSSFPCRATEPSHIFQYDKKNKRGFLKRCEYPTVQLKDIFIGATIAVYSRQLKVVDYADEFTAKAYGPKRSRYGRHPSFPCPDT
jgi:nucleoside-diphosphate kinase